MNKNFRKAMISTICLLIVGIMTLTGVTYAWFTSSQTAQVNGIAVNIASADGGVLLSGDGSQWTYSLDAVDTNAAVTSKVPVSTVKTLTGDDKLTFYKGEIVDAETPAVITSVLDEQGNYFFSEFQMKNANATNATVSIAASVEASKATVKNAIRWAIVDKDENKVYIFAGNNANDNATGDEDYLGVKGAATEFDSTVPGANVEYVALDTYESFSVIVEPVIYNDDGTESDNKARSFAIYAWMEGNDSDCVNALSGSNFNVNLSFNTELDPPATETETEAGA